MKTTNFSFIILLVMTLFIITCKKEKNAEVNCKEIKVGMVGATADTAYIYFSYDTNGKLIKTDMGSGYYFTYSHETNKITAKYYVLNAINYTDVYSLNAQGLATSSTHIIGTNTAPQSTSTYEYDGDGYLLKKTLILTSDANDIEETNYNYDGGNLTSIELSHTKTGYSYSSETTYDYYMDKLNKSTVAPFYLGKISKNLQKTVSVIALGITVTSVHAYELDGNGNVKKDILTIGSSVTYQCPTYQCN